MALDARTGRSEALSHAAAIGHSAAVRISDRVKRGNPADAAYSFAAVRGCSTLSVY